MTLSVKVCRCAPDSFRMVFSGYSLPRVSGSRQMVSLLMTWIVSKTIVWLTNDSVSDWVRVFRRLEAVRVLRVCFGVPQLVKLSKLTTDRASISMRAGRDLFDGGL